MSANANALDSALQKLALASTALERSARPNLKDVEEAKEAAKAAGKILDAAYTLLSCGVYTVAEEPDRLVDMQEHEIHMPPIAAELVADEPPAALPPFPGILAEFDGWSEEDQLNEFERRLEDLRVSLEHPDEQDLAQWDEAWQSDPRGAFELLLIAEAREPRTFAVPDEDELTAWRAQFAEPAPEVPEHLQHWRGWDEEEQLRQFEALLQLLEDAGVSEAGLRRKDWKKAVRPWQDLWTADREKAWDKLWQAYHVRDESQPFSWDIPADPEPQAQTEEIPADVDPFETEGGAQ